MFIPSTWFFCCFDYIYASSAQSGGLSRWSSLKVRCVESALSVNQQVSMSSVKSKKAYIPNKMEPGLKKRPWFRLNSGLGVESRHL